MGGLDSSIIDAMRSLFDAVGWAGVVIAMAIESACIPLPSEIVMPLAGWLIVAERDLGWSGVLLAALFGAIGNLIGAVIAYEVGARGGRPFIDRFGRYILLSHRDLDRAERWFNGRGEVTVFVSRLLPVVRTFISFPAGIARMNFLRFAIYSFVGSFLWCIPLTAVGYHWGPDWERIQHRIQFLDYPIALAIVAAVAWFIWHRVKEAQEVRA
jgi:membrane protein DedA with SNARE-associated domain